MERGYGLALLFLAAVFVLPGCEKSGREEYAGGGKIDLLSYSEEIQTAFADDALAGSFTFASPADWVVFVMEGNVSASAPVGDDSVSWLRLLLDEEESRAGEAGTYTLTVSLEPNRSGVERSATIVLVCGRDRVAITVTQSEKNRPEPEPAKRFERYVAKIVYESGFLAAGEYSFRYDDMQRIERIDYVHRLGLKEDVTCWFDLIDDATMKIVRQCGSSDREVMIVTLNGDGSVVSLRNETDSTQNRTYNYEKGYLVSVMNHAGYMETLSWWNDNNLFSCTSYCRPYSPYYYYTNYANNPKMNLDLNGLFTREFDLFTLLGMTGTRSRYYVSVRTPWGELANDGQESFDSPQREYDPLDYDYDAYGYVKKISLNWVEKKAGTVTDDQASGSPQEITNSVSWYITYTD